MILDGHETERFRFRALTIEDTKIWERFIEDPSSLEFFPSTEFSVKEYAVYWIERQLKRYENNEFGLHALIHKETGEFLGQCGLLKQVVDGVPEVEIGYSLMPDHKGKGYATEAATYCKELAKERGYADHIISIIHQDNIASQNVAKRNGMTPWKDTEWNGIPVTIFRIDL